MVPERIKAARRAAGLSTRALAAKIGVSAMAISKWERGTAKPTDEHLKAVAEATGRKPCSFNALPAVTLGSIHFYKEQTL